MNMKTYGKELEAAIRRDAARVRAVDVSNLGNTSTIMRKDAKGNDITIRLYGR